MPLLPEPVRFQLAAPLWQIRYCDQFPLVGLELRKAQNEAQFAVIDTENTQLCPLVGIAAGWGLEDLTQGVLLLHAKRTPDGPEHLGLAGYDAQTGKHLWTNLNYLFLGSTKKGILARNENFLHAPLCLVDIHTGEIFSEFTETTERYHLAEVRQHADKRYAETAFPDPASLTDCPKEVAKTLTHHYPVTYVKEGDWAMFHGYVGQLPDALQTYLFVYEREKLATKLDAGPARGLVHDAFWWRNGVVWFAFGSDVLCMQALPR
jgi:hypothetical protein